MNESNDAATTAVVARLAQSRAEISRVLEPPPLPADGADPSSTGSHGFPRSRTMKLLLSGRGIGTVGAVVGGLVLARPALALRLLRVLPTGAVARMLVVKAVSALRAKNKS